MLTQCVNKVFTVHCHCIEEVPPGDRVREKTPNSFCQPQFGLLFHCALSAGSGITGMLLRGCFRNGGKFRFFIRGKVKGNGELQCPSIAESVQGSINTIDLGIWDKEPLSNIRKCFRY